MSPKGKTARLLVGVLLPVLASITFSTCGGTGIDLAGGGVSGTGVSTGAIASFGSVEMNGVHYLTDNNTIKMSHGDDHSSELDRVVFRVGMVVTIHHDPNDNNAQQIDYQDNLQGPIAARNSNTLTVLGQTVVVDNAAVFNINEIVGVSGFVDSAGRIRATYIERNPRSPHHGGEIEVKGFVSGLDSSGFRLGPLPDETRTTVTVSYGTAAISGLPTGLDNGMYVQVVTADPQPVSGTITATSIEELTPRTVFPNNARVDLEGLVTAPPSGSGTIVSFAVEGKPVGTDNSTQFPVGNTVADIRTDMRVQVQGTENGGVLSAAKIIFR